MAYILGLVIVGFLFLSLHYFTELTKHQKILISFVVLVIILGAVLFNTYSNTQREKMLNVVTKFKQHKTIKCEGTDVSSKNYTLSIGTYTFIGKQNTSNYGKMISVSNCQE